MATTKLSGTLLRADHHRPAPSVRSHYAAMRRYENAARSISVRRSVGSIPADELEQAKAAQTGYYLMAAAYRSAGRRRERVERRAANWKLFRQEPARYFRLTAREMGSTARSAFRRIVKAVSA